MAVIYNEKIIQYASLTSIVDIPNNEKHIHTFWEITYPLYNKEMTHFVNNHKVVLNTNTFLIMKPNDTHQILIHKENEILRSRNIFVDNEKMIKICNSILPDLYDYLIYQTGPITVSFPALTVEVLESRLNFFGNYENQHEPFLESIHATLVSYLLGLYLENQIEAPHQQPSWLKKLLNDLNDPTFASQKISDIVKSTNYSHSQVCRLFKRYIGKTLIRFILEQRLRNSITMLMDKNKLIIDIAMENGFCSQNSYINAFKKIYGLPPAQWRKLNTTNHNVVPTTRWG